MIRVLRSFSAVTMRRTRSLWRRYGIFWLGAILVGLVAVYYARLIDWGFSVFSAIRSEHAWLPLVITPAAAALSASSSRGDSSVDPKAAAFRKSSPCWTARHRRRAGDCSPCAFSSPRSASRSSRYSAD